MNEIRSTDPRIAAWLADGPVDLPAPLRTAVLEDARRARRARPMPRPAVDVRSRRWVLLAAAALLVVALAAAIVVGSRLLDERKVTTPDLGARQTAELVVPEVRRTTFTYRVPTDLDLVPFEPVAPSRGFVSLTLDGPGLYDLTEAAPTASPTAHGIVVFDLTNTMFHGSLQNRLIRTTTPEEFLADLDASPEFAVANTATGRLGTLEAVVADVKFEGDGWSHLDIATGGVREGSIEFAHPNRMILTNVGDLLVGVQVWAPTSVDLEAWLPVAMRVVDTIDFPTTSADPSVAPDVTGHTRLIDLEGQSTRLDYVVPGELGLRPSARGSSLNSMFWFFSAFPPPYGLQEGSRDLPTPGSRGVTVVDAMGNKLHGMGTPGFEHDPQAVLDLLDASDVLRIDDVTATELGGFPALSAWMSPEAVTVVVGRDEPDVEVFDRFMSDDRFGMAHLDAQSASMDLRFPSRLIVANVDHATVLVQVWAVTRAELEAWLPEAMRLVDSFEFPPDVPA